MAFKNFVPELFSAEINMELDRELVFAASCTKEYRGVVSEQGDRVKILGLGDPAIATVTLANRNADISAAEEIDDQSIYLDIDQIRTFHYTIGDIDRHFSIKGLEAKYQAKTAHKLANSVDTFIGLLAQGSQAIKYQSASVIPLVANTTTAGILNQIDGAIAVLWGNDVSKNEQLYLTVTPRAYMILKQAYIALENPNAPRMENGKVGKYGDVSVDVSNNVATLSDVGATDFCILRTKNAIAYVHPVTFTEAYRPDLKFSDCIKGYILFGARIVKPKELVVLNWKYV